jgi:hypothetical protein
MWEFTHLAGEKQGETLWVLVAGGEMDSERRMED